MKDYLALIDHQTLGKGMRCRDITPIFGNHQAFNSLIQDLCLKLRVSDFDVVVGIEALGFILATAIAQRFEKGLIPIRKAGKLPVKTDSRVLAEVRGQARTLELRVGALTGARVLLVDDWIKSGTQMIGAIQLVEGQGGIVAGVVALNVDQNELMRPYLARYVFHTLFENGKVRDQHSLGLNPQGAL